MTMAELREQSPVLYRTILLACDPGNKHQQAELGQQILIEITTGMLVRGEKTLDMLQALLVYNMWCVGNLINAPLFNILPCIEWK
jgi:hypothetical protein